VDRSVAQGRRTSPSDLLPVIAVAVVAFAAARLALLPGVGFWDTAEFQTVGALMGTAHPTGFPTYVLLSWLAAVVLQPFGEPAFRVNLLSAVCLAVAAGITVDLVRALTRSAALGVLAGLGLALTPIAWAIGTHADPHVLHLALLAALLRLLVAWEDRVHGLGPDPRAEDHPDRFLAGAAFVFALSVGNHSLTLLLAVPVGLYVLAVAPDVLRRPRLVATCVAVLAVTLVVLYLELPLRAGPFRAGLVYGRPETWDGFWYVVLAEQFRGSLLDPFGNLAGKTAQLGALAFAQFGVLAPLIPVGFVATAMRRPRYALLTGSAVAITCFFAASYVNADINRYYLGPVLMAWTWLAILAAMTAAAVGGQLSARRQEVTAAVLAAVLLVPTVLVLPGRLATVDVSRDHAAAAWLDRILPLLGPEAVIVSWWSYSTPLWYAQRVEGRRPDIFIADDRTRLDQGLGDVPDVIDDNLGRRPVYVMRQDPADIAALAERYDLEYVTPLEAGLLVRVIGLRATP
jgi:transmembrane protein TMEM260 (protein O-mannosyltransferase)